MMGMHLSQTTSIFIDTSKISVCSRFEHHQNKKRSASTTTTKSQNKISLIMTNYFDIINFIAFVSGTNKSNRLGRAIVDALLEHDGAKKIYATAQDAAQLEDLVLSSNGRFVAVSLDVTADDEQTGNLGEQYPDVNLVANNAGYFGSTSTLDIPENGAIQEMQVNYFAPLNIVCSFSLANSRCSQTNCFHCKSSQLCSGWHILRSSLLQGGIALLDSSPMPRHGEYFGNWCAPWINRYCNGIRSPF
jgi:hypothetical protein